MASDRALNKTWYACECRSEDIQVVCSFRRTLAIGPSILLMLPWQAVAEQEPEPRNLVAGTAATARIGAGRAGSWPRQRAAITRPASSNGLQRTIRILLPGKSVRYVVRPRPGPRQDTASTMKSPGTTGLMTFFVI